MAEFEFAGTTFRGGKMFAVLTALSTLGGGLWGGFEFYKDYMDMKEIIQNIDIDEIAAANELQLQKLEDAIGYTTTIKDDLKIEIRRLEGIVDTLEDDVIAAENTVRTVRADVLNKMDTFEERLRLTLADNQKVIADLRDKINSSMEASEARIKATQSGIGDTLEGIRNEMNILQKDVTNSIREVEGSARESEKIVRDMIRTLETDLNTRLQEALDNPLAN
jgi:GTPase SAR1 family protein